MRVQFMGDRLLYCDDNIVRITKPKTMFKKEEVKEIKVSELSSAKITGRYQIIFYDNKGKLWDAVKFTDKDYLSMANKIANLIGTELYNEAELKTAEEMYRYCKIHGYGEGWNEKWGVKHFKLIEDNLLEDEKVLLVFMGLYNYKTLTEHGGNCAFAITNKRILIAQQKVIGEFLKLISIDMINDISSKKGLMLGIVEIDTLKETFNVRIANEHVDNILNKIHNIVFNKKNIDKPEVDNVNKLRELKSLMDEGILTQEEFESEKKKILG